MELNTDGKLYLQKYLAVSGIASRRKSEILIEQGKVTINGKVALKPYDKVDVELDKVTVDGIEVRYDKKVYIMLNKPLGVLSTAHDPFGRRTVVGILPEIASRIYPVGRLDFDSEGLMLLTNDGDLAFKLTHPKSKVEKEYLVTCKGKPNDSLLNKMRMGVDIGDCVTLPAVVKFVSYESDVSTYSIIIREGKKRQIRKMFSAIGYSVKTLKRTRIGNLYLKSLKPGEWRHLSPAEITGLTNL